MGPKREWYAGVADVELAVPRYAREHHCLVHDARYPFPDFAKINFDAVLFTSTFMDLLGTPEGERQVYEEYGFLAASSSVKIALPQDDYWCSEVRDAWYCNIGVDRVYPVCERRFWPILLPRFYVNGGSIEQGFTTYVTPRLREVARKSQPWSIRRNDIVYRAKQKPIFPNHLGYLKGAIGDDFRRHVEDLPIRLDISVAPSDSIRGEDWWDFVANSRGILGSPSGSSLLVRNHEVAACLLHGNRLSWDGNQNEESHCTQLSDREHDFTAIAPRNVEAALLGTAQILVPGDYGGLMEPGVHFLPLNSDASNAREVVELLLYSDQGEKVAEACQSLMMNVKSLQVERLILDIVEFVRSASSDRAPTVYDLDVITKRHATHMRRANAKGFPARIVRRGASSFRHLVRKKIDRP
jgi:hypothetical protein